MDGLCYLIPSQKIPRKEIQNVFDNIFDRVCIVNKKITYKKIEQQKIQIYKITYVQLQNMYKKIKIVIKTETLFYKTKVCWLRF